VHRGGRSLEGRQIGTTTSRQPVAQDPIDQADCRERRSRERWHAAAVRGRAPTPPPPSPQPATGHHDDDDAATSTAASRCPDRDGGRRVCSTRLGRGRPVRELQTADFQVHKRDAQRRLVRLVGREAKEVGRQR